MSCKDNPFLRDNQRIYRKMQFYVFNNVSFYSQKLAYIKNNHYFCKEPFLLFNLLNCIKYNIFLCIRS